MIELAIDSQVILGGDPIGGVVGVLVSDAMTKYLRAGVMTIAKMDWHGYQVSLLNFFSRGHDGRGSRVALGCKR